MLLQHCTLKVNNVTITPTEISHQNTLLLEKQDQQHESNVELREENVMLPKKVQGKPCIADKNGQSCGDESF